MDINFNKGGFQNDNLILYTCMLDLRNRRTSQRDFGKRYRLVYMDNEEQQKWKTFQHLDAEFLYWYSSKVKHMVIRDDKSEQEGDFQGLQW